MCFDSSHQIDNGGLQGVGAFTWTFPSKQLGETFWQLFEPLLQRTRCVMTAGDQASRQPHLAVIHSSHAAAMPFHLPVYQQTLYQEQPQVPMQYVSPSATPAAFVDASGSQILLPTENSVTPVAASFASTAITPIEPDHAVLMPFQPGSSGKRPFGPPPTVTPLPTVVSSTSSSSSTASAFFQTLAAASAPASFRHAELRFADDLGRHDGDERTVEMLTLLPRVPTHEPTEATETDSLVDGSSSSQPRKQIMYAP